MSDNATPNLPPPKQIDPAPADVEVLPIGTRLAEFEIKGVLGRGGFGIVYLALDLSLQRQVAIKEYLPAALAVRCPDGRLSVRSGTFAETFQMGLSSFVNESRLLARFDHLALVKVHRFWEANGTAYMVMPYYQGVTLTQVRQSMIVAPTEAWLRRILTALLGALDVMHNASVFHRDVAPDNIVLLPSGLPVLLDFGAARHVLAGQAQTITALVKPAYAPIEQYAAGSEFRQGPWTDIYGAAATLHYCLTGRPPPTAAARIVEDDYEPLSLSKELLEPASGEPYERDWLAALDWGLEVKPQDRPQSIAQWRQALDGHAGAQVRPASDRASIVVPARPQPKVTIAPTVRDPVAQTDAWRPAPAASALWARVTSAPKALPWATAGVVLAALLGGGWQALAPNTPTTPITARAVSDAPEATAVRSAARVGSPRVVPIVHSPASADDDGEIETAAGLPAPAPAAAPASPGKRKPKALKPKANPPAISARSAESRRGGPQVVEAKREPAWTRAAGAAPTPRELCSDRGFLGSLICMGDTCASAKWARHAQCRNWHQMEQRNLARSR